MKKILLIALSLLLVAGTVEAQGSKASGKGKKKENPVISGKQKIRQADYLTFDKFTTFSSKKTDVYFTPFDYSTIPYITGDPVPAAVRRAAGAFVPKHKEDWGEMKPVMNYLEKVSRATMTMCAVYAVNPDITDSKEHDRLAEEGRKEALACLDVFSAWMKKKEWRNKVQYKVVEVDYRYFKGANYYNEQSSDEVIHVGMLLYFGSKKKAIITADTTSRTFKDIKFFPHDATIVDSWYPMLDELSDYLKENDRKGVLLTGYTDNQGTEEYCKGLSRQRAVEVKKALQMRGIDATRIEIEAMGSEEPIGDNDTYEGRIQNNRVSIKIQ